MKVLVVGAGMGGLTAARTLLAHGFEVQVVDQASELREVGSGLGLFPAALHALDKLGLGGPLRAGGVRIRRCFGGTRHGLRVPLPMAPDHYFMLRSHLQTTLYRGLEDRVQLGFRCQEIGQDQHTAWAKDGSGHCYEADFLVGADGVHSQVRHHLLGEWPLRPAGYTSWRAVLPFSDWPPDTAGEIWGWGRRWGTMGLPQGEICWWATLLQDQPLHQAFQGWPRPIQQILAATPAESIHVTPLSDLPTLPRWGLGRITLLGDAAHATTPNLGAGAGMAILDAQQLALSLSRQPTPRGLRHYESRRRLISTVLTRAARALGWLAHRLPL